MHMLNLSLLLIICKRIALNWSRIFSVVSGNIMLPISWWSTPSINWRRTYRLNLDIQVILALPKHIVLHFIVRQSCSRGCLSRRIIVAIIRRRLLSWADVGNHDFCPQQRIYSRTRWFHLIQNKCGCPSYLLNLCTVIFLCSFPQIWKNVQYEFIVRVQNRSSLMLEMIVSMAWSISWCRSSLNI